jgi:hypothetical protein
MRTEEFHINLDSASYLEAYENNNNKQFVAVLPESINLDPVGDWYCALISSKLGFRATKPYYLCCDLCHESQCGDLKLPTLRLVYTQVVVQYHPLLFVPVKVRQFREVKIFLRRADGAGVKSGSPGVTYCTLAFVRGSPQ